MAAMAINEATAPGDVIVFEGEATNTAMVGTDILVVVLDFKFRRWGGTGG